MTPIPTPIQGRCTLVGAGPGDPDLLTLKAVKAIAAASVLFVDDLVDPAILGYARRDARIVHVGKRGGCRSTPQAFIERLMITAVREGETVVRLKGGDPFIFGRGGEEVEHLRQAGIECEVVNGITAGLAALTSLGVALTHRDHAQGVVLVTGHARTGDGASGRRAIGDGAGADREDGAAGADGATGGDDTARPIATDWAALARTAHDARLTLVIYMGVAGVEQIQAGLLRGLPGGTPAAVIQHASLARQRHVVTTLAELGRSIANAGLASPAIIVVGDVLCGLRAVGAAGATNQTHGTPAAGAAQGAPRAARRS